MQATSVPRELFSSWQFTLEHWNQGTAHDSLLGIAAKHQQLAWLAARYRATAHTNPQDYIARDRLKRVQRASAMLAFAAPPAADETTSKMPKAAVALLLASVVMAVLGIQLTDFMRHQTPTSKPTMVSRHP